MLRLHVILELVAVAQRHDLVAGTSKYRLHELQVGVRVVDHHHLRHAIASLTERRLRQKCNAFATARGGAASVSDREVSDRDGVDGELAVPQCAAGLARWDRLGTPA